MSEENSLFNITEADLMLILDSLNDSFDDVNHAYMQYEAIYGNSHARKAKIEGMKRMVDKHAHAIDLVESLLRNR